MPATTTPATNFPENDEPIVPVISVDVMDFEKIKTEQEKFKSQEGKYFQVKKNKELTDKDKDKLIDLKDVPLGVEIHEHVGPEGVGFTVYERKTELGQDYIKASGFGGGSRTTDWIDITEII